MYILASERSRLYWNSRSDTIYTHRRFEEPGTCSNMVDGSLEHFK
jgi:hypothetical protein